MTIPSARDLPVIRQYHLMVYAFQHEVKDVGRLGGRDSRWSHWWERLVTADPGAPGRMIDRGLAATLDDTYFFLPHVRELLFPETALLARHASPGPFDGACKLLAEGRLAARLPTNAVRRFTLAEKAREGLSSVTLRFPSQTSPGEMTTVPLAVDWIDLALFPQQVGFLIIKAAVAPDDPTLTMGVLGDALRHARMIQPLRVGWQMPEWHIGPRDNPAPLNASKLIDLLLQEVTVASPSRNQRAAGYAETDFGQTYGNTFHLFTYAALGGTPPTPGMPTNPSAQPDPPFDCTTERALYELMSLTNTAATQYVPHPAAVESWRRDNCMRLWCNWQAALHQNHMVFLGLGDPDWTDGALPHNVLNDYFPLYLLALFQKIAVSFQFPMVSRRHVELADNVKDARRMWRNFLEFESRYWVTEPTRRPQGKLLYAGFQKGLDVKMVYDELRTEVEDVQKFYESIVQRRSSLLIYFLTVVGLPLGIYVSLFGTSVVWKLPRTVWRGLRQGQWPDFSQGLETEKANAVVWLLMLVCFSFTAYKFTRWLIRRFDAHE